MAQVVQVAGPRKSVRNNGPAFKGIAPGAGGTATVAFGASRNGKPQKKKQNKGKPKEKVNMNCWNAFHPAHLPLPRAVGEYTVSRGTKQLTTNEKLIIIGTWQVSDDTSDESLGWGRNWTDVVALGCEDLTKKPSEVAWTAHKMPMLAHGLGPHSQIVPAACSVQVMNANALQTTSGMVYIGKLKVQPAYAGDTFETAQNISDNFVSFMAPRLCAAAKLALRGVQVDAHPLNMNRLADFTQIHRNFVGETTSWQRGLTPVGFTPIVIYNPDGVELNLLICQEFRTRFELFNPACSSHKYHPPSTDVDWAKMIKKAADFGNGVMDIADAVAKSGIFSGKSYRLE